MRRIALALVLTLALSLLAAPLAAVTSGVLGRRIGGASTAGGEVPVSLRYARLPLGSGTGNVNGLPILPAYIVTPDRRMADHARRQLGHPFQQGRRTVGLLHRLGVEHLGHAPDVDDFAMPGDNQASGLDRPGTDRAGRIGFRRLA
jgi:hypothetical protein